MNKPMLLADFVRLPPDTRAATVEGLSGAIDAVAQAAAPSHRFLRYQWFAAALAAYGGAARTIVIETGNGPQIALPMVRWGPPWAALASVPGCYWPFRSFPAHAAAGPGAFAVLAERLAREVNALRIGPVVDGDPALDGLLAAARAKGWTVLDRFIADDFLFDLAAARAEGWPRTSTLRKNRFHEKHLAGHGALEWTFARGDQIDFDALAGIERKSWIATRTDGRDAKFAAADHGRFWHLAAADPVLAGMLSSAVLRVAGAAAAFSFDLDVGTTRYAVANSYDPAFARHSPGKLLYYRNLVQAGSAGIRTVDWGAGDSGYKQTIGAASGPAIRDWVLLRPGLPALLGAALRGWWARSGQG